MKLLGLWLVVTAVCCGQEIAGDWHGWIEVPDDAPLRLALHISANGSSIDSMDEGVAGLAIDDLSMRGAQLQYAIRSVKGSYTGTVTPDGQRITGYWSQDGGTFPLIWRRGPDPAGLTKPLDASAAIESGRASADEFYHDGVANLWARLGPVLCQSFGDQAGLERFRDDLVRQWGRENRVISENLETRERLQIYRRQAVFANGTAELDLRFNPAGAVVGISLSAVR